MKKKLKRSQFPDFVGGLSKLTCIMKLTLILILLNVCVAFSSTYSQQTKFTLSGQNVSIRDVLSNIESKSEFRFFFNSELINLDQRVNYNIDEGTISQLLDQVLLQNEIQYEVKDRTIILSPKPSNEPGIADQQQRSVSGKVTDSSGAPLPGVTVVVKGSTQGTITDTNGNYSLLNISRDAIILFSFVGMKSQEVAVAGKTVIDVVMTEDAIGLEEVVAVGYGAQKMGNLTGAISSVKSEAIMTTTHSSVAQKLQGKVAGLNIRQNSGQPGQFDNDIQIRGFGNPLYVIDGVIRNDAGAFQKMNAEDIESISVLKDASAAIYGIGAANGVIIVTTKQGTKGKTSFNFSAVTGLSQPTNRVRAASAPEYTMMLNEAALYSNPGRIAAPAFTKEDLQKWQEGTLAGYTGTDWWDLTMKDYSSQTHLNLSASGGSEKMTYYMGMEYVNDNGILKSGDIGYDRANLRSNLTADLLPDLRARLNMSFMFDKAYAPGESYSQISRNTIVTLPTEYPYANNNPNYPGITSLGVTPLAASDKNLTGFNNNENRNLQTTLELKWTVPFMKNLVITATGSYDNNNYRNKNLRKGFYTYTYDSSTETYVPKFERPDQNIYNRMAVSDSYMLRLGADYNVTIAENHDIKVMLLAEQSQGWGRSLEGRRYYGDFFTNDQLRFANEANQTTYGYEDESARLSYIGRLNYDYARKYLFEFAFNYNGSYRYHPDHRFGFFPTVSTAWRLSEENFIKENLLFVSNMKLRASYGVLGTDQGDAFQYVQGFTFGGASFWEFSDGTQSNGLAAPAMTNRRLSWSENHTTNLGLDLSLWEGKLDIAADWYRRLRKGLISTRSVSLPNTFGTTIAQENLNSDVQTGFDLVVGHRNTIKDFTYQVSGNMNFNRSKSRHTERAPFQSQMDRWLNDNTDRWGNRQTGYRTDGQFTSFDEINNAPLQGQFYSIRELPGDYKFRDLNNDGIINGDDSRVPYTYGTTPLLNFGLTIDLEWKGFDANILFQGAAKYTVRYTETLSEWFWYSGGLPAYFMDRWHQADPYDSNSEWIAGEWPAPRPNATQTMQLQSESDLWRRDAAYVRLKSLELGYTCNPKLLNSIGLQKLRLYINGFNLFTLTKDRLVKKLDPEKTAGPGTATYGHNYPLTKSYNIGLNLTF